jgi:anaerobic selenocysteine-containing dehydrogenase
MSTGEPIYHSGSGTLFRNLFTQTLRGKWFSCSTIDEMPTYYVNQHVYGHALFWPSVDLLRTQYFLIMGSNPAASHVLGMVNVRKHIKDIQERGGKVIVVDPRRTETAKLADEHVFIRPGTDALFRAALINTMFKEGLIPELPECVVGLGEVKEAVAEFTPELVAERTGIDAATTRRIAREYMQADSGFTMGHIGTVLSPFATLSSWLMHMLNIISGHMDKPGGLMFKENPLFTLEPNPEPGPAKSRINGITEFIGQLPMLTLPHEITTPGEGQVRCLVTLASNPVMSTPANVFPDALEKLDFMVSLDFYINATSRHADLIIPPVSSLERDDLDSLFTQTWPTNLMRWSDRAFDPPEGALTDAEILSGIGANIIALRGGPQSPVDEMMVEAQRMGTLKYFESIMDEQIKNGIYGKGPEAMTLDKVKKAKHGVDLGPLVPALPEILPERFDGSPKRIDLPYHAAMSDFPRLRETLKETHSEFVLIGRRDLRSVNSWTHNLPKLVAGKPRCVLLMNPVDANRYTIDSGDFVRVKSPRGNIEVLVEVTDVMMPGVVSIPHGFGHLFKGTRMSVAKGRGVNMNELTDPGVYDPITGNGVLSAIPVEIEKLTT